VRAFGEQHGAAARPERVPEHPVVVGERSHAVAGQGVAKLLPAPAVGANVLGLLARRDLEDGVRQLPAAAVVHFHLPDARARLARCEVSELVKVSESVARRAESEPDARNGVQETRDISRYVAGFSGSP
jgi:hypothetical protein